MGVGLSSEPGGANCGGDEEQASSAAEPGLGPVACSFALALPSQCRQCRCPKATDPVGDCAGDTIAVDVEGLPIRHFKELEYVDMLGRSTTRTTAGSSISSLDSGSSRDTDAAAGGNDQKREHDSGHINLAFDDAQDHDDSGVKADMYTERGIPPVDWRIVAAMMGVQEKVFELAEPEMNKRVHGGHTAFIAKEAPRKVKSLGPRAVGIMPSGKPVKCNPASLSVQRSPQISVAPQPTWKAEVREDCPTGEQPAKPTPMPIPFKPRVRGMPESRERDREQPSLPAQPASMAVATKGAEQPVAADGPLVSRKLLCIICLQGSVLAVIVGVVLLAVFGVGVFEHL